jgi:hypothetical protein
VRTCSIPKSQVDGLAVDNGVGVVIIKYSRNVFARERVGGVADQHARFADAAVAHHHDLDILTHICWRHAVVREKQGKKESFFSSSWKKTQKGKKFVAASDAVAGRASRRVASPLRRSPRARRRTAHAATAERHGKKAIFFLFFFSFFFFSFSAFRFPTLARRRRRRPRRVRRARDKERTRPTRPATQMHSHFRSLLAVR